MISLLIAVIVIGLIYWLVTMLPLPEPFKNIAIVIVIILAILYFLKFL